MFRRELLPPPQSFYERELGRLTRANRKGWSQARCPFHESGSGKSFSVNLKTGGFYCFGCDAKGGDVVAFVMLKQKVDFKTAGKILGCMQPVDEHERRQIEQRGARLKEECVQSARAREAERSRRIALRDEIHTAVYIQAEVSTRLSQLLQGAAPAYENEVEDCWGALSMALDDLRDCEAEYMTFAMENAA